MNTRVLIRFFTAAYLLLFFAYLFGPLIIMSITAFNSSAFPRMIPWECLTFEWFGKAANDTRLKWGLQNSAIIGTGVVALSVTLGLAGALFLTQVWPRFRAAYYTIVISPVLMPGVVLGISTILFWDRTAKLMGASTESGFYNGLFLTILGQSSFIASYCMLIFIARLQRFDTGLMEAALDLGATHTQAFRKILLPFLKPAIGSAANTPRRSVAPALKSPSREPITFTCTPEANRSVTTSFTVARTAPDVASSCTSTASGVTSTKPPACRLSPRQTTKYAPSSLIGNSRSRTRSR